MLRTQTEALSKNLKIPMEHLRWFAAFHNEGEHPHVHLIAYSTDESEGYLSKQGVENLRSSLAKDIFAQELMCIYEEQTERRDTLKSATKQKADEIIDKINHGTFDNPVLEDMLVALADKLSKTDGKKVYGFLKPDVKDMIDNIVDELSKDERIAELYDLWYKSREEIIKTYTEELPPRIPLSKNTEFKSIKNTVIKETLNIIADKTVEDIADDDMPEQEPQNEEIEADELPLITEYDRMKSKAELGNKWAQYGLAKMLLDRDSDMYNPREAVKWLVESAKQDYTVAQYMLGKLFLKGEDVPRNVEYALRWLEEAVTQNNQYAEYLFGKTLLKGVDVDKDTSRAESLLSDSAKQGNKYAAYTLGKAYLDGTEYLQDVPKAIELLKQSADKGFAPAQYVIGKFLYKQKNVQIALEYLEIAAEQKNPYAAYLAGKILLTDDAFKDTEKAIRMFKIAAERGNDFAEYQLGKMLLYGKDIEKDYDEAIRWLTLSAEHGNQYAQQLLHSIKTNGNWAAAIVALRMIQHTSRIIQNRLEDERKNKSGSVDRKLKRKIDEKKQAHGLKQG